VKGWFRGVKQTSSLARFASALLLAGAKSNLARSGLLAKTDSTQPLQFYKLAFEKHQFRELPQVKIVWRKNSHLHRLNATQRLGVLRMLLEGLMHGRGGYAQLR